jgi:hypothetical protein
MARKFIQAIHLKKGALHRELGIPLGKKIPVNMIKKAAKQKGKLGKRARFALTLRKFHK